MLLTRSRAWGWIRTRVLIGLIPIILVAVLLGALLPWDIGITITPEGRVSFTIGALEVYADPGWLSDYEHRREIPITGATGAGTNYQVPIDVFAGSGTDDDGLVYLDSYCEDFPNDIRFTDDDSETLLDYWETPRENISTYEVMTISGYAVDADGNLWASAASKIWKSTNGGDSWQEMYTIGYTYSTLFIDSNGNFYVAGVGASGTGIYRSTDQGENWTKVQALNTGCLALSTDNFAEITTSGTYQGYLFFGVYSVSSDPWDELEGQIFRSTNNGVDWSKVWPSGEIFARHMHLCRADPYHHGYIYATSGDWPAGWFNGNPEQKLCIRSIDGGTNWTTLWSDEEEGVRVHFTAMAFTENYRLFGEDYHNGWVCRTSDDSTLVPLWKTYSPDSGFAQFMVVTDGVLYVGHRGEGSYEGGAYSSARIDRAFAPNFNVPEYIHFCGDDDENAINLRTDTHNPFPHELGYLIYGNEPVRHKLVPYYQFWVKITDDLSSNQDFYIYYSKSGAASASNKTNTFTIQEKQVGASADDGYVFTAAPSWNNDDPITYVGHTYDFGLLDFSSYYRFTGVTIPSGGAKILEAYISLYWNSAVTGVRTVIKAEDTQSPTQIPSKASWTSRVRTTAGVNWNDQILTGWRNSPEIKTVVQELVDTHDYSSGAPMQILHDETTSTVGQYSTTFSWDWGDQSRGAELYILARKYVDPEPSVGTPESEEGRITNTPTTYNFGTVNASSNYTTDLTYFNVTNNSGGVIDITISGTNMTGGTQWTLNDTATPGSMMYGLKAGAGTTLIGYSDPDTMWTNETKVYDGNTTTYAYTNVEDDTWGSFLELNCTWMTTSTIRFYAGGEDADITDIDIYVTSNETWTDVYNGTFTHNTWINKTFIEQPVTKVRVRFYNTKTGSPTHWDAYLYELNLPGEFNITVKLNSPYNNLVTGLADNTTQAWGLQLWTPTAYSDGIEKSGTVTLMAAYQ